MKFVKALVDIALASARLQFGTESFFITHWINGTGASVTISFLLALGR